MARYDPVGITSGVEYGRLDVIGDSVLAGRRVRVRGLGMLPEVGGRISVDDRPDVVADMGGEQVKLYPTEEIVRVVELELAGPPPLTDSG